MKLIDVFEKINLLRKGNKNILLAIDGRSGSGKTTISNKIKEKFNNVKIISLDDYDLYKGEESVERFLNKRLIPLSNSKQENMIYIVEGVFSLSNLLIKYYDFSVWVECDKDVGYQRGLERDIALNNIDNSKKWEQYWLPLEQKYIDSQKPHKLADITLDLVK
jgi:uridine kinase